MVKQKHHGFDVLQPFSEEDKEALAKKINGETLPDVMDNQLYSAILARSEEVANLRRALDSRSMLRRHLDERKAEIEAYRRQETKKLSITHELMAIIAAVFCGIVVLTVMRLLQL